MNVMRLQEYLEAHKEVPKEALYFSNERKCSLCGNFFHVQNSIFLMGTKINKYGTMSMNLCKDCLPNWQKEFKKHRLVSTIHDWHWSCWDLDKPMPHTEVDRVFLYLENGQFFLQTNFNPSRRERVEEIR
jgi:hypothetical protein